MPAWIWILALAAVGFVVFVVVFHPFRRGAHAAPRALPVRVDAGSMTLAEEQTLYTAPPAWLPGEHTSVTVWMSHGPKTAHTAPLGPYGGQLGPRARDVLDRYNARCVERWGHAIAG